MAAGRTNRLRFAIIMAVFMLMAAGLGGAVRWVRTGLQPLAPRSARTVRVDIPSGASTNDVAQILAEKQIIRTPLLFSYYARYRKLDVLLKPGEFELSPGMAPEEILQKMARGEIVIHRFTIPEGLTVAQIADRLATAGVVDRAQFLQAAASSKLADPYLPNGVPLEQPLEGYLFPDTYEYRPGATADEIVALMFGRSERLWTPALREQAAKAGLSIHQVTILASIVEGEAQAEHERPIIAGVYMNRFRIGMKLDADPTVRYGIKKPPKEELLLSDLKISSPYNTYLQPGLPPGPIGSPGLAAIKAVLAPAKHDYWYFVAKADGSGEHYFATTLDEQGANIAKSQVNAK